MAGPSKTTWFSMKTVIVILSIFLPTGAIWFDSVACASVMFFVAVFLCQGQQRTRTGSLRGLIIHAAVFDTVRENNLLAAPDKMLKTSIHSF